MDAVVTREHGECSQTVGLLLAVGSLVFDTASHAAQPLYVQTKPSKQQHRLATTESSLRVLKGSTDVPLYQLSQILNN